MSEQDGFQHNLETAARQDLVPLIREVAGSLGESDELAAGLVRAWSDGARAGHTEMSSQGTHEGQENLPDYERLMHSMGPAAAQDINSLQRDLAKTLGVENDDEAVGQIAWGLAKAWMAGAQAGQVEVVAEAIEQGANVDHRHLRAPRDDEPS